MKGVSSKDLEDKVKRGMVDGLFQLLEADFGVRPDIVSQMREATG